MILKRFVINQGKKISNFFANDLQNKYYVSLFLKKAKKEFDFENITVNKEYEENSKKWWKLHAKLNIDCIWHSFYYGKNNIMDVRYIPENIYYGLIEPKLNNLHFADGCDDKCYYSEMFPHDSIQEGLSRQLVIMRNINGFFLDEHFNMYSIDEAAELVSKISSGYVIKASINSSGGAQIVFVKENESKSKQELINIFESYDKNFIIEGLIHQCVELSALNASSINTIRIISYLDSDGVHVLSSCLRVGGKNSNTDNFASGGIAIGINQDGNLKDVAYDKYFNKYNVHPSGVAFAGKHIPSYDKAINMVKTLHKHFAHYRIISWDISISPEYKPVLIEFNLKLQSIDLHQVNNGPLFGDLTEKMLNEIF